MTLGAEITFGCNDGYSPGERMTAVCEESGWRPNPALLNCTRSGIMTSLTMTSKLLHLDIIMPTHTCMCACSTHITVYMLTGGKFTMHG